MAMDLIVACFSLVVEMDLHLQYFKTLSTANRASKI